MSENSKIDNQICNKNKISKTPSNGLYRILQPTMIATSEDSTTIRRRKSSNGDTPNLKREARGVSIKILSEIDKIEYESS